MTPGKIAFIKPTVAPEEPKEQVALFKPADLRESFLKLRPGDKVDFSIVQQDTAREDLATDVTLVSRASAGGGPDGKPLMGCVISVKEGFGFIRCAILHPSWDKTGCHQCSRVFCTQRLSGLILTAVVLTFLTWIDGYGNIMSVL